MLKIFFIVLSLSSVSHAEILESLVGTVIVKVVDSILYPHPKVEPGRVLVDDKMAIQTEIRQKEILTEHKPLSVGEFRRFEYISPHFSEHSRGEFLGKQSSQ